MTESFLPVETLQTFIRRGFILAGQRWPLTGGETQPTRWSNSSANEGKFPTLRGGGGVAARLV